MDLESDSKKISYIFETYHSKSRIYKPSLKLIEII